MHTSVIRYRVADFLGEHPPFDAFALDDLLSFAGTGRVSFHEDDVFLYRKGDARKPVLWVIQQGRIELVDETPAGERLWDVLGPGDILGLATGRAAESGVYPHAARTATEAILYAFDVAELEALVARYPAAARYLAAHLSATARHTKALRAPTDRDRMMTEREKAGWLVASGAPAELASRRPVACPPELPARDLCRLLGGVRAGAVAVTAPDGAPLGLVTSAELCAVLASSDTGARAESIMRRDFRTARRGLRMADYFMEMMRGRCRALAITEDGTAASPLLAVLTDDDLTVDGGRNPALLVAEMLAAETLGDLAHVRARAEAFVAEGLVGPSSVEWFWRMVVEVDDALVERLVALAEREMARAGWIRPSVSSCWLLFGQAGRGERLAPTAFDLGAVYGDPAPEERERAAAYFTTLAGLVLERLPSCGLLSSRVVVDTGAAARPLSEWIALYADRVRDPIGSAIASVRSAFDVRAACGDRALAAELEHSVAAELERAEAFVPVLANDAIANLPPLTFTRDRVIDSDGVERATLDLEASALDPVADAARVAALAGRRPSGPNTLRRLEAAAAAAPQFLSIFDDAAEGFRILAYHDAVARRARPDDPLVTPARLGRFEQRMLKSAFDMARRFLDLTYTLHNPGVAR